VLGIGDLVVSAASSTGNMKIGRVCKIHRGGGYSIEHIITEMKKQGVRVHHVEGVQQGRWVLLDFVDFVVHIFHPTLRSFYQIERLWSDAEVVPTV
jgi:ribosomal silencing factor RsfS